MSVAGMCSNPWHDHPLVAKLAAAVAAVRRLYDVHPVGGNCHIVTDDGNVADDHIDWCLTFPHERPLDELERDVLTQLRALDRENRTVVLERYWKSVR